MTLMNVLKICCSRWENASRDQRELNTCKELGYEVSVLAKGEPGDKGRKEMVNDFLVYRYTSRPCAHLPNLINRVISAFQWARFARHLNPDIITGHDIDGWTVGLLTKFFCKKKPLLIYDSHEFELGRNVRRSRCRLALLKFWERIVIRKSVYTIVVNDSIADELVNIYKLKERPIVVRNIPNKWKINHDECEATRRELERMFENGGVSDTLPRSYLQK